MIYTINEARNVEEYRAEKAAREKAEKDERTQRFNTRYNFNRNFDDDATKDEVDNEGLYGPTDRYALCNYKTASGYQNTKATRHGSITVYEPSRTDKKRDRYAQKFAKRNNAENDFEVRDAVNRNMRKHPQRWNGSNPVKPKSESTIFDTIEII